MTSEYDASFHRQPSLQPKWISLRSAQPNRLVVGASLLWIIFSIMPTYLYFNQKERCMQTTSSLPDSGQPSFPGSPLQPSVLDAAKSAGVMPLTETLPNASRAIDFSDAFADFNKHPTCNFSSLDLHAPFEPLCPDRKSLLSAMSGGGRIGVDAPYIPRGCDMRWFTTEEICKILARFQTVFILGDSLMRNIATAANVLLQEDLWQGAWAADRRRPEDSKGWTGCNCGGTIAEHKKCDPWAGAASSTNPLWSFNPKLVKCPRKGTAPVEFIKLLGWPIDKGSMEGFTRRIRPDKPDKPIAFVFGSALWNNANVKQSENWVDQIIKNIIRRAPYLADKDYPRLFVSPSAAGPHKAPMYWATQGNVALARFEKELGKFIATKPGIDFLGTFNLTIQADNPDGTHGTYASTLTKAMMVFNWLDTIDTTAW